MTQLVIIVIYLLLLLGVGALANHWFRGDSQDYMLASRTIGPFFLLMSLFGTTMTAFALVGSTNKAFAAGVGVYGMLASASGIIHSLCFFLIGIKMWSFGKKFGFTTQIEFFRARLENDFIGLLLFPVLIGLIIPYLLIGVISSGGLVFQVTDGLVPAWAASLAVCLVVMTYVFFGGMRGTAWANALQTMFFMAMGVITFVLIAQELGGKDTLWESMRAASETVLQNNPTQLARTKLPPPVYFSFLLIPLSVAMFPHVFQHWLTARNANAFKLPIIAHPIFIMVVWLPCVMIGVWASGYQGLLAAEIPKDRVLASLVHQLASPMLGGLLAAGILAAIMSSLDSQFLCLGTMLTNDIVNHYHRGERISERKEVLIARSFIVAVVAITYLLSLVAPPAIFSMGIWCFSGFAGLFPLAFASVYWKRLTAAGAIACVLAVAAAWAVMFAQSNFGADSLYAFPQDPVSLGVATLPPMMPVVALVALSTATLVFVSLLTRPPSQETLDKFFE